MGGFLATEPQLWAVTRSKGRPSHSALNGTTVSTSNGKQINSSPLNSHACHLLGRDSAKDGDEK